MQTQEAIDNEIVHLEDTIRQQIIQLQARIRALREMRNTLAPISCLPAELLSRIFFFTRERGKRAAEGRYAWIRTTFVCRAWRSTAIACTTLWTEVDFVYMERAVEMLKRSKNAPVDLKNTSEQYRTRHHDKVPCAPFCLALSNIDRAGTVTLTECPLVDLKETADELWPVGAPFLQSLTILGCYNPYQPYSHRLPESFVSGSFPKLQKVHLQGFLIPWHADSFFRGLTNLNVTYFDYSSTGLHLSEVMDALQNMQLLEHLALSIELMRAPESMASITKVELHWLATLELQMQPSTIMHFLDNISPPRDRLELISHSHPIEDVRALVHYANKYRLARINDGYTMDAAAYIEVEGGFRVDICDPARVGSSCPLQVTFRKEGNRMLDLAADVLEELPMRAMKTVMVHSLAGFLATRPYIEQCTTLCASFIEDKAFFDPSIFYHTDGSPWLSDMQTFVLYRLEMRGIFGPQNRVSIEGLIELLNALGGDGSSLQTIQFLSCHPYGIDWRWLEEVTQEVHHLNIQSRELQVLVDRQDFRRKTSAVALKAVMG